MKTLKTICPILIGLSLVTLGACSSLGSKSSDEIASSGPTVLDAKTDPGTFELNRDLKPKTGTSVIADVKDFNSKVTDVRLHFTRVPLELKMKKGVGDEWIADLSQQDLRKLAVAGETMKYEATIVAKNERGQIATSKSPVNVYVKAPDTAVQNS